VAGPTEFYDPACCNTRALHASPFEIPMRYKELLIVIAVSTLPILALCQKTETQYKVDTVLAKCLEEHTTTAGMADCLATAEDLWDKELNKYYRLLLLKLDTLGQKRLKESQKQWLIFRDNEIKFISRAYGNQDGTMWIIIRADRIAQLVRRRAVDLIEYYEMLTIDQ
jgi:uncharacterized protein YecT (DUF1311 family)